MVKVALGLEGTTCGGAGFPACRHDARPTQFCVVPDAAAGGIRGIFCPRRCAVPDDRCWQTGMSAPRLDYTAGAGAAKRRVGVFKQPSVVVAMDAKTGKFVRCLTLVGANGKAHNGARWRMAVSKKYLWV